MTDLQAILDAGGPWEQARIIGGQLLILADCREVMSVLPKVDAVVTDPPYGMDWNGKVTVGKGGHGRSGAKAKHYGKRILNDDRPFDPSPFMTIKDRIFWGFNHFPQHLSKGRALVWIKRSDEAFGSFLSDAELAWCSSGHGVYCFRDQSLMAETKHRAHPTQKPVPLMEWCIKQFPDAKTILDPFMGSGTTLVACQRLGRQGIGIELDADYFEIACKRVQEVVDRPPLFTPAPPKPTQGAMDL